jgi:hypothetical protein
LYGGGGVRKKARIIWMAPKKKWSMKELRSHFNIFNRLIPISYENLKCFRKPWISHLLILFHLHKYSYPSWSLFISDFEYIDLKPILKYTVTRSLLICMFVLGEVVLSEPSQITRETCIKLRWAFVIVSWTF